MKEPKIGGVYLDGCGNPKVVAYIILRTTTPSRDFDIAYKYYVLSGTDAGKSIRFNGTNAPRFTNATRIENKLINILFALDNT